MPWPPTVRNALVIAGCAGWALACGGYDKTVRLVDGELITERPISASAYAAYANAARLEARGELRLALDAYRDALSYDSHSVDIQTRIATLTCQLSPNDANQEFEDALDLDENYEGLWRQWALCELRRGKLTRSLRMARRALEVAPRSLEASLALMQVYEARKEPEAAVRVLVAYVIQFPESQEAWRELYHVARRQHDPVWNHAAGLVLNQRASNDKPLTALENTPWASVGRALVEQGLAHARNTAVQLGVSTLDLGWIALERQHADLALEQADLVLSANPNNLEAAILGVTAAHRSTRPAEFSRWLRRVPQGNARELSPYVNEQFMTLLRERVGPQAAVAFAHRLHAAESPVPLPPPDGATDEDTTEEALDEAKSAAPSPAAE